MCENARLPLLRLRGLCSTSKLDSLYVPHNPDNSGRLVYIGLYGSVIQYDKETLTWVATVNRDATVVTRALSAAPEESLLLGSYQWKIYNDSRECTIEESYSALLTLSGCSDSQYRRTSNIQHIISHQLLAMTRSSLMLSGVLMGFRLLK